jgi:regulation of enolase protein 1 (concanavalin A-like superfamily)
MNTRELNIGIHRMFFASLLVALVLLAPKPGAVSAGGPALAAHSGRMPAGSTVATLLFEDHFTGAALNPSWHWSREVPTHWSLSAAPGYLRILTQPVDIWRDTNNAPLLLRAISNQDFTIQTRIVMTPAENYHQGGLVIYQDDDNYVRLTYAYIDGLMFEFGKEVAGEFESVQVAAPSVVQALYLQLVKRGTSYSAYYSQDGVNWTYIASHQNVNCIPSQAGLLAFNAVDRTLLEIPANFDYFRVTTGEEYFFVDVLPSHWAWTFIERLYTAGITGGCATNPLLYCPEQTVTRAQMAVFLLKGIHTSSYTPPPVGASTGFGDVPTNYWAAAFIKQLAAERITSGCGGGNYCPGAPTTRAEMAVFLLRAKHGASYTPPPVGASTGFGDVQTNYWAAAYIKQLAAEGITSGCGNGNYCPEASVTRAEMATFLVRTFSLP